MVLVFSIALIEATLSAQSQTPRNDLPQPYKTTRDWGQLPPGVVWAAVTAIEPAPDGAIYVIHRCFENSCAGRKEAPILKYDANGKILATWGQGMFIFPHGATVDREGNLWVTDARGENGKGHQVFKFSPQGKLLMTLGNPAGGKGTDYFWQPNDVLVAPNGDIFVAEGHSDADTANARILKFSKDGKFIKAIGKKGTGPGEFAQPHALAMDSQGRLFVGDRSNNRIQILDQDGKYITEWTQFSRPSGIYIDKNDVIYVADSESGSVDPPHGAWKRGIRIGSAKDGSVTAFIPDPAQNPPSTSAAEGVAADASGNIYGAEVGPRALKRYVKR
jgi:DNA-binding beta-propeller fold protein YncE